MKRYLLFSFAVISSMTMTLSSCSTQENEAIQPLAYSEMRLGAVRPEGWLKEMLERQRDGMTSRMDVLYPSVMGSRNGWLGGDGDQWERGPYWIDGLVPLAYILDDEELKQKARPWVEWALASQQEDGFFGPSVDYAPETGLQRNNSRDWWPRMVVLKYMQQYYSATEDVRVLDFMKRYFRYQFETLPQVPLGNWTFWAEYRACDNLNSVLWLYRKTGEPWLIDLARILHSQSYNYVDMFLNTDKLSTFGTIHCVNLAQGIKEPVIWWQVEPEQKYLDAVKKGFADIRKYNGFPCGMYGGDEALHGNNPTQGSELCSAVELMYSLEEMIKVTGDLQFVEHLERIAFNALPTQITDDFMARQYFQQANQVMITRDIRNFDINHAESDLVFGLLTGYPCCTSNFHQAWPKFTQNLWYTTSDGGLAALAFSPCRMDADIDGTAVTVREVTRYPMEETVRFEFGTERPVRFPFHFRIPSWAVSPQISVNGVREPAPESGTVVSLDREWRDGDVVELSFPMKVTTDRWYENSISVERGPLVYALKIKEKWVKKDNSADRVRGDFYYEVYPESPWNYGIIDFEDAAKAFEVTTDSTKLDGNWYWNTESAPISIKAEAKRIPSWKLHNNSAGPLPYSKMYGNGTDGQPVETITLIPYGCSTLRISEFPVI